MSSNWVGDIEDMHDKYGFTKWVDKKIEERDYESLRQLLEFRAKFLREEFEETMTAIEKRDYEEVVDGLIDLCVVAIGTLDLLKVNGTVAWNRVFSANMNKEVGIKESRPNPLGLPDLIKPEGWTAPSHKYNHGILPLLDEGN